MENELLAITLAKMMVLNPSKLAHLKLIVLNILKYKHCVSKSLAMSRDHFANNRRLLVNWQPV